MRISPNFVDANRITRMHRMGMSVDEISQAVKVMPLGVRTHLASLGYDMAEVTEEVKDANRSKTRRKQA